MQPTVIKVKNLGKKFKLNENRVSRFGALRYKLDQIISFPSRIIGRFFNGKFHKPNSISDKYIWALKNVSFEIKKGEIVGLVGHNGAGKSVLLKILSRITKPTVGFAEIRGTVSSLLEVDTGFHNDLTGRENIFMSGAILGMKRSYIQEQFPQIIAFSGLGNFIDTPVKRYSSGMRVKLAFAIGAQLKPEILILDEILAVADEDFKAKSLAYLQTMVDNGQTILLVSHHKETIQKICNRVLVMKNGTLVGDYTPATFQTKDFSYTTI